MTKNYYTATEISNIGKNDPISYILKNNSISKDDVNIFSDWIVKKGLDFEIKVNKMLMEKVQHVTVCKSGFDHDKLSLTEKYIKKQIPLIFQAPLHYKQHNVIGIADILVRCDMLNVLFDHEYLTNDESGMKTPDGRFLYVIIDIKFKTLRLACNGITLLNSCDQKTMKTQLYCYHKALSEIQGVEFNKSFIFGRKAIYVKNRIQNIKNDNVMKCMGTVLWNKEDEFDTLLKSYIKYKNDYDKVKLSDKESALSYNYGDSHFFPNMKSSDCGYDSIKNEIAKIRGELTKLWNVGVKQRNMALKHGVSSWYNEKCTAEIMGFTGNKARILNELIKVNRDTVYETYFPLSISNMTTQLETILDHDYPFYCIDFETITEINDDFTQFPTVKSNAMIYLIGIVFGPLCNPTRIQWLARDMSMASEKRIINQMFEFLEKQSRLYSKPIQLVHWSSIAEPQMLEDAIKRHVNNDTSVSVKWNIHYNDKLEWVDLCDVFRTEPIVFPGQFTFGLKDISQAMKRLNHIKTAPGEGIVSNGMDAMVAAINYYNNTHYDERMKEILKYNSDDCESLLEMVYWLRKTYCKDLIIESEDEIMPVVKRIKTSNDKK